VVDTIGLVILLLSLVLLSGMSGAVAFVAHLRREGTRVCPQRRVLP
jgi:hypothetical protein